MILSVVIVSYNVKFFLEQCLSSVKKAIGESSLLRGQTEVFVVDNASTDGTVQFLQPLFPGFHFIQNTENTGFARANNQMAGLCSGKYMLFLNPDTILAEDSLETCISFLSTKSDAGAVGVRMVDGAGRFLKESKRGFPGVWSSFFKMAGFTKLFPRSKIFSSYYLGHLDETKSHAVDILSGAYLMTKKDIFTKSGGFDEQFFMFGEDIDLSYRICQEGFKNYYVSDTTIIHFKGESTSRDLRYVKMFYGAMILFMKKHFRGFGSSVRLFLLTLAVKSREAMAYIFTSNHKKEGNSQVNRLKTVVRGDPSAREKWKRWLDNQNIPIAGDGDEEEIIFCEGPLLSWKEIIKEIAEHPDGTVYLFHGLDTHAAVSSFSNRLRGEVFEI